MSVRGLNTKLFYLSRLQLAKELRNREEEIDRYSKERIKIEESGGIYIKAFVIQKNPFPKNKCEKAKCLICKSTVKENLSMLVIQTTWGTVVTVEHIETGEKTNIM